MGADALRVNGISQKFYYLFRDKKLTPKDDPLRRVRKSRLILFLTVQLIGFGATFAITQTIGKSFSEWGSINHGTKTSSSRDRIPRRHHVVDTNSDYPYSSPPIH